MLMVTRMAAVVVTAVLMTGWMSPAVSRQATHASWTEWSRVHTRESYPNDWHTQRQVEEKIFDGYDGELLRRWDTPDAGYRLKEYNVRMPGFIGWDCGTIEYVNSLHNDNGWVAQWKEAAVGGCWT